MNSKNKSQELLHKIFLARAKKEDGCLNCRRNIKKCFYQKKSKKYLCACLLNVSPFSGTPMNKTHVKLDIWFELINDILVSKSGIDAKWVETKFGLSNSSSWTLLRKIRDWLNMVEQDNCQTLSRFVKPEGRLTEKLVLKYNNAFAPKQMQTKMLNILPPLFEHLRDLKNAS